MTGVLEKICQRKRRDLAEAGAVLPFPRREFAFEPKMADRAAETMRMVKEEFFLIAETKKASPSAGVIREDYDPVLLARSYQRGGARGISVLTEGPHFQGSLGHLEAVCSAVSLPVLRKDFILHPVQVDRAAGAGARLILLIAACLDDGDLLYLQRYAEARGLLALTEAHTAEERDRAVNLGLPLLGINNRDLTTFEVRLETSLELIQGLPPELPVISESGIGTAEDLERLGEAGFAGALVGEALLSEGNPQAALERLKTRDRRG